MATGVIYILTNPSFPEYVKIGYADDLEKRLNQLNRSETIPFAFRVYAVYETDNRLTDIKVHDLIDKLNPDLRSVDNFDGKERKREFYAMSAEDAYELFDCIAQISGTSDKLKRMQPEGHEIIDENFATEIRKEKRQRRKVFNFYNVGLHTGDIIKYLKDDSITAIVVDGRHISYNGEITSLSALAAKLLGISPVQGTLYFTYNDVILNDLRIIKEKQQ